MYEKISKQWLFLILVNPFLNIFEADRLREDGWMSHFPLDAAHLSLSMTFISLFLRDTTTSGRSRAKLFLKYLLHAEKVFGCYDFNVNTD